MIETVRGPIKPEELGICACHEHVHIDLSHIKKSNDTALTDYDRVKEDVARFIKAGGKAFIEMTNVGMGRNIQFMRRLSEELDMHIVASTGCYKDPFIPAEALSWNREQFAAFMLQEIEEGIDGSCFMGQSLQRRRAVCRWPHIPHWGQWRLSKSSCSLRKGCRSTK
ncbi:hypothetical protein [Shouchella clausii]|uniref:phosphotriesterase family protein n=1 Tax=Shouchella clausii TaxID=79880 RepID=UPI0038731838